MGYTWRPVMTNISLIELCMPYEMIAHFRMVIIPKKTFYLFWFSEQNEHGKFGKQ